VALPSKEKPRREAVGAVVNEEGATCRRPPDTLAQTYCGGGVPRRTARRVSRPVRRAVRRVSRRSRRPVRRSWRRVIPAVWASASS